MTAPAPTRLEDYAPFPFLIDAVRLALDLDAEATRVRARLEVRRRAGVEAHTPLALDGEALELVSLRLDGAELAASAFETTARGLVIFDPPAAFALETEVVIRPALNRRKRGLFAHVGKLASQCEAQGFCAVTFFPDRPDVLSRYEVRLTAERGPYPVLLSNGERVAAGEAAGGRHFAVWRDPHPKPCYIFAVVAGDFGVVRDSFVTKSGRDVALAIYAEHGEEGRCLFALEALKAALLWEEETFGLEYDLSTYNIVALSDYAGAQENKGLNLFGAEGVVADPAITLDEDYVLIKRIIGHEAFHNWTGNRVTCRDWFQLSLKEGLTRLRDQLFMEDLDPSGVFRIEQVRALRRNQFPEDDGPAAHPIQPRSVVAVENLYTTTIYDKGAEVLRMLRTLLGPAGFVAAVRAYLGRFDGQAVAIADFLDVAEETGGRRLAKFRTWIDRAGRPLVRARGRFEDGADRFVLDLEQVPPGPPDAAPLHIPVAVALIAPTGERLGPERVLDLVERRQSFVFENVAARPTPSILRGFSAPVSLETDLTEAQLAHLGLHDDDAFVAWDSVQTLFVRTIRALAAERRAGRPFVVPGVVVDLMGALLVQERRPPALRAALLLLPDEPAVSEGLAEIDLDGQVAARAFLKSALALALGEALLALRARQTKVEAADRSPEASGRRALRSACLDLLAAAPDGAALCLEAVRAAPSLTEQYEALAVISHLASPLRAEAAALFLERYAAQPLVVDKWFRALALSRAPGALADIMALESHPLFDPGNIARAIAFYGGFFRQNRVTFHEPLGGGYAFLADRLLLMDERGGGRPGYFMAQIDQWRRFDPPRRTLMRAALERVAATPGVSPMLAETVGRALA